jgi:predicted RNase H-like nuclease
MRFVGVDLAWTTRGGSGVCAVEHGRVVASGRVGGDDELLAWLAPFVAGDVLVAIDAPLIVRNQTGRRAAEQLISRCFGAHHASAHSANLGLPAFRDGVRGEQIAAALGLGIDPDFPPRVPVRRALEVYPHSAIVALFRLATTLKYKAKPGRSLASCAAALDELLDHLETLRDAAPQVDVRTAPRWQALRAIVASPPSRAELARAEDEVDAFVCAYTGLYYWTHGTSRCRIAGDAANGYILTPVTPELGACLDRAAAEPTAARDRPPRRRVATPTELARNVRRVQALLPAAVARLTPHVGQLVVAGDGGLVALVTAEAVELRVPTGGNDAASRFWKRLQLNEVDDEEFAAELEEAQAVSA